MDAPIILLARCCRDWPVMGWARMGRCGYCKQVPEIIGAWEGSKS